MIFVLVGEVVFVCIIAFPCKQDQFLHLELDYTRLSSVKVLPMVLVNCEFRFVAQSVDSRLVGDVKFHWGLAQHAMFLIFGFHRACRDGFTSTGLWSNILFTAGADLATVGDAIVDYFKLFFEFWMGVYFYTYMFFCPESVFGNWEALGHFGWTVRLRQGPPMVMVNWEFSIFVQWCNLPAVGDVIIHWALALCAMFWHCYMIRNQQS